MVPLYVRFGDDTYRDYVDLSPAQFYALLGDAVELPRTSQPTPGDFQMLRARDSAAPRTGTTDEEIDALVERFRRKSRVVFRVDTLEFPARGGRIGRARAWAGELPSVKPILTFEGEIVPVRRVRGSHKAFLEFARAFEEGSLDGASLRVGIANAEAPEREAALRELVRRTRPAAQIEVATTLGAVVGAHAGPGTVGFFWWDDREIW